MKRGDWTITDDLIVLVGAGLWLMFFMLFSYIFINGIGEVRWYSSVISLAITIGSMIVIFPSPLILPTFCVL